MPIHAIGTMTGWWSRTKLSSMTPSNAPSLPRTEHEFRAQRLGFALRSLAAELVDERYKVAALRREVAELKARLKSHNDPRPVANEIATRK